MLTFSPCFILRYITSKRLHRCHRRTIVPGVASWTTRKHHIQVHQVYDVARCTLAETSILDVIIYIYMAVRCLLPRPEKDVFLDVWDFSGVEIPPGWCISIATATNSRSISAHQFQNINNPSHFYSKESVYKRLHQGPWIHGNGKLEPHTQVRAAEWITLLQSVKRLCFTADHLLITAILREHHERALKHILVCFHEAQVGAMVLLTKRGKRRSRLRTKLRYMRTMEDEHANDKWDALAILSAWRALGSSFHGICNGPTGSEKIRCYHERGR